MNSLKDLTSEALVARLHELAANERLCVLDIIHHVAELETRKFHLDLGYPSTFAYCTDVLRLTRATAYRRTVAAKLLVRFPVVSDYLADGRLCPTTLVLLEQLLTEGNHHSLLDRAANKTEDEVRLLVATLAPKPDVAESIRRLPTRSSTQEAGFSLKPTVESRPM